MALSVNAVNFLNKKPTHIGCVMGFNFYEHPTLGDESPLLAITESGKFKKTDFWEMPTVEELASEINDPESGLFQA